MNLTLLSSQKQHLAELLEAIQRCVYFLDVVLFEAMAAINERFAKLQDTLGAAMRHACILSGEPADSFLK